MSNVDIRILVVDDEEKLRHICALFLQKAGYSVDICSSGEEAAARLSDQFDIVLTDLDMPGAVNGNELTRRVRASTAADVLIMTAYPELETAIQAIKDGAYDYLVKPFSSETLLLAVERCVHKRRLSAELLREKALRTELDQVLAELSRAQRVREIFGQFATREVAEAVMAHPDDFWQRGERREVTVMFMDVRGFTAYSQTVSPEVAVLSLNEIFEGLITAIQAEKGIVNKFMGDGLMALFGAPTDLPDHAQAAARAALKALESTQRLALFRNSSGREPLRIGLAVNTGSVIAGCLGVRERTEYSVIGPAVNMAARLEKLAAPEQILLGPETARRLNGGFVVEALGPLPLAGFPQPIDVWALQGSAHL